MFNIEWMKTVTREQFIEQEKHNAAQVPAGDLGMFYDGVVGVKSKPIAVETPKEAVKEPEVTQAPEPAAEPKQETQAEQPAAKEPSAEDGL